MFSDVSASFMTLTLIEIIGMLIPLLIVTLSRLDNWMLSQRSTKRSESAVPL